MVPCAATDHKGSIDSRAHNPHFRSMGITIVEKHWLSYRAKHRFRAVSAGLKVVAASENMPHNVIMNYQFSPIFIRLLLVV